jgi:predicted SAM-dependent methyltransferase
MVKFSVGAGKRFWGEEWVHVDGADYPHIASKDVVLLDYPNNHIDLLVSSHLIAYFNSTEADVLLSFWYAKLKPGGILRVSTPDFNAIAGLYKAGIPLDKATGPLYGKMPLNDSFIYHRMVYDETALHEKLERAGFTDIHRYDHKTVAEHPNTGNREDYWDDHSAAYIDGTLISLNMECNKPLL